MSMHHLYFMYNDKNKDNQSHSYFIEHVTFQLGWEPLILPFFFFNIDFGYPTVL